MSSHSSSSSESESDYNSENDHSNSSSSLTDDDLFEYEVDFDSFDPKFFPFYSDLISKWNIHSINFNKNIKKKAGTPRGNYLCTQIYKRLIDENNYDILIDLLEKGMPCQGIFKYLIDKKVDKVFIKKFLQFEFNCSQSIDICLFDQKVWTCGFINYQGCEYLVIFSYIVDEIEKTNDFSIFLYRVDDLTLCSKSKLDIRPLKMEYSEVYCRDNYIFLIDSKIYVLRIDDIAQGLFTEISALDYSLFSGYYSTNFCFNKSCTRFLFCDSKPQVQIFEPSSDFSTLRKIKTIDDVGYLCSSVSSSTNSDEYYFVVDTDLQLYDANFELSDRTTLSESIECENVSFNNDKVYYLDSQEKSLIVKQASFGKIHHLIAIDLDSNLFKTYTSLKLFVHENTYFILKNKQILYLIDTSIEGNIICLGILKVSMDKMIFSSNNLVALFSENELCSLIDIDSYLCSTPFLIKYLKNKSDKEFDLTRLILPFEIRKHFNMVPNDLSKLTIDNALRNSDLAELKDFAKQIVESNDVDNSTNILLHEFFTKKFSFDDVQDGARIQDVSFIPNTTQIMLAFDFFGQDRFIIYDYKHDSVVFERKFICSNDIGFVGFEISQNGDYFALGIGVRLEIYSITDFEHKIAELNLNAEIEDFMFHKENNHQLFICFGSCLKLFDLKENKSVDLIFNVNEDEDEDEEIIVDVVHLKAGKTIIGTINGRIGVIDVKTDLLDVFNVNNISDILEITYLEANIGLPCDEVYAISPSDSGELLLVAYDNFIILWDLITYEILEVFPFEGSESPLFFNNDEKFIIPFDDKFHVVDTQTRIIQNIFSYPDGGNLFVQRDFSKKDKSLCILGYSVKSDCFLKFIDPMPEVFYFYTQFLYVQENFKIFLENIHEFKGILLPFLKYFRRVDLLRTIISSGYIMSKEEFEIIIDACWDLVDTNESSGGNMYQFVEDENNISSGDEDDY
eukprot:TRINITY_DN2033_c1_g1_i1.p1 TRINITY_DN2033_c1_g1~~TRINITY_DN2033_c1_g1_i1.p1  ORF type:complete len:960 (+),score=235.26 TRINITY_DN2033_c1_g1_i1:2359-5238(+)